MFKPTYNLPSCFALFLVFVFVLKVDATRFAEENFLVAHSPASSGNQGNITPLSPSPLSFLERPAGSLSEGLLSVEAANVPVFDDLSNGLLAAIQYSVDPRHIIRGMTGMVTTNDIPIRPILSGTYNQRQGDPSLRPGDCSECPDLRDRVYYGALNIERIFNGNLPRSGIESRPIPAKLSTGLTAKYYWEELEGGDYIAQALNLDAGVSLEIASGFNPINHQSERDFRVGFYGFEILPTSQRSTIGDFVRDEKSESRWNFGVEWLEGFPRWKSQIGVGLVQKSDAGPWPGLGIEWLFVQHVVIRGGLDSQGWAGGASLNWHGLALNYALTSHDLGITKNILSVQVSLGNTPTDVSETNPPMPLGN